MISDIWLQLKTVSMLSQAGELLRKFRNLAKRIWDRPYAAANPRRAIGMGSVWFTWYPASAICREAVSPLRTLADPAFLRLLKKIGFRAIHTGPIMRSGVVGIGAGHAAQTSRTTDGWYDQISYEIDPE